MISGARLSWLSRLSRLSRLSWLSWLSLRSGAAFGASIQLPAGEDPARWALALQMGDFTVPGDVVITDLGARWEIRVRDGAGQLRVEIVDEPQGAQAREDVVLLASSLLQPLRPGAGLPGLPPALQGEPPRPPPPPPDIAPLLWASVADLPAILPPEPDPPPAILVAPGRLDRSFDRVEVARRDQPWLATDQRALWRPGTRPTVGLGASVGWRAGPLLLGLDLDGQPSAALTAAPEARMGQIAASAQAWWALDPLRLGLEAGCAWRTFTYAGERVGAWPVGVIGAMAAAYLPISPSLVARPWAGLRLDLASGRLQQGDLDVAIPPLALTVGLAWHLPGKI